MGLFLVFSIQGQGYVPQWLIQLAVPFISSILGGKTNPSKIFTFDILKMKVGIEKRLLGVPKNLR